NISKPLSALRLQNHPPYHLTNPRISKSANKRISKSANLRISQSAHQRISESAYKRLNPPVGGQAIKRNKRISESAFGSPPVGAKHLSPDTASAVLMCRDGE